MTEVHFSAGEWIFRTGDPGERAYLIQQGQVEVLLERDGSFWRTALIGPGNVLGEMSLVEDRPRSLSARALDPVTALTLTREEFERLLLHNPQKTLVYLKSLFERLRFLSAKVMELATALAAKSSSTSSAPSQPGIDSSAQTEQPKTAADAPSAPIPAPGAPAAFPLLPGQTPPLNAPKVVIHPLTRKAAETLPDEGLWINHFPLRIGRAPAANEPEGLDLNDLWLLDDKPYNVSRNHCEIALDDQNRIMVRDRGSHLGCIVNEVPIGGRAAYGYARLHHGDNVLILGGRMSPYQFRVTVE